MLIADCRWKFLTLLQSSNENDCSILTTSRILISFPRADWAENSQSSSGHTPAIQRSSKTLVQKMFHGVLGWCTEVARIKTRSRIVGTRSSGAHARAGKGGCGSLGINHHFEFLWRTPTIVPSNPVLPMTSCEDRAPPLRRVLTFFIGLTLVSWNRRPWGGSSTPGSQI